MPFYESVVIARQDVSAQQVEELTNALKGVISERGGSTGRTEYWGLRNLAYRIKKNRKGHYVLMNLDAPSQAVEEMERQLRLNEDVIRYMTLRVEELEEEPSVMMQTRAAREATRRERVQRDTRGGDDSEGGGERSGRGDED